MSIRILIRTLVATALAATPLFASASTATDTAADDDMLARGAYVATASDCIACHTAPGGKPMAGGLKIESPVGEIFSTNITPSTSAGIGGYSEAEFSNALRHGIRADGANLYPAMPYTAYTHLTDADIHALYVYFMQGVEPVDEPAPVTQLPFPMNLRFAMKAWNLLFLDDTQLKDDPEQSAQWNRGRYLVEGPAHCSTCHTPRGLLMQEKHDEAMTGAQVGAWFAPNITADDANGIGSWSEDELVTYLRTGKLDKAQAAGSMAEAISHSFQHLSDADLRAIATYMGDLTPTDADAENQDAGPSEKEAGTNRFNRGQASEQLTAFRGRSYQEGLKGESRGAQIYSANCASCHNYAGQGTADGYYPSLFHNAALGEENATNLLATILNGVDRETDEGHVFMPPFGDQPNAFNALSNDDIAALSNYLLTHFGNADVKVAPADVQTIRDGGPGSNLVMLARIGMGVGILVGVLLILYLVARRRRRVG